MVKRDGDPATSTEAVPAGHAALAAKDGLGENPSEEPTRLAGRSVAALGVVFNIG